MKVCWGYVAEPSLLSVPLPAACLPMDSFVVCEAGQQRYLDKRERFRAL